MLNINLMIERFKTIASVNQRSRIVAKLRQKVGNAVLETSITLPILCVLIFFILEMIKINDVQMSVDAIAMELAFDFMSSRATANFNTIIDKHRPPFIRSATIRWYITHYPNITKMNEVAPYGGSEVYWPNGNGQVDGLKHFIDVDSDGSRKESGGSSIGYQSPTTTVANGTAFVLTVVCYYPFSSSFVKSFIAGGSNTESREMFLVWGRCVGICGS
ncbi:MAG: hypothetical protein LBS14_03815 [Holosporaceae bacterium]|jgi:hypothetical protein|nr:hypothetical protein [Holosporaceae bacterium]